MMQVDKQREKEVQMAPKKEHGMESNGGVAGQAGAVLAERAEELAGSIDQTMDSAAQTIQATLQHTKKSAKSAMGTVVDGIETSSEYLSDRGMAGMAEDVEALIRRYPLEALLIGSSVGFLLSRSWKR